MKILYLANIRIPTEKAHGVQIMKMVEAFTNQGVEVELVVPRRRNRLLGQYDPFQYYNISQKFKIKKLPCLDLIIGNLHQFIGSLGFWIQTVSFLVFLLPYVIFQQADFIYCRDEPLLFFLSLFKKNLIFEAHSLPKPKYNRLLKKIKKIIVITHQIKELLIKRGISDKKILVAADAVDLKEFVIKLNQLECRNKLNLPLDKKIVLYNGHLFPWKGVYILAQSTEFLPDEVIVVFVGGMKTDLKKLERFIEEKKLSGILLLGHRQYQEIPYFLQAADILVLPNSGQYEISELYTSPIKLFEYMAAKKPIVASDLPSIREILNQRNSVLVKPDQPKLLAENIIYLLNHPALTQQISQQAFIDVQNYTWKKRAEKIISFINK